LRITVRKIFVKVCFETSIKKRAFLLLVLMRKGMEMEMAMDYRPMPMDMLMDQIDLK